MFSNGEFRLLVMTNLCINYSNDLWFISISRCCYFFVCLFPEFWLSEKAECDVTDKRGSKTLCGINLGTLWLPAFCQLLGTRGFWDGLNAINRKHTNLSETVFLSFWRVLVFNFFFIFFTKENDTETAITEDYLNPYIR